MVFDQLKKLHQLRKQAQEIQKELASEVVEVEFRGIKIKIRGDQQIENIIVDGKPRPDLAEAINRAIRQSQKAVAFKMRGKLGDFGIPGV